MCRGHAQLSVSPPNLPIDEGGVPTTIIGWGLYGSRFLAFLCKSNKVARPFFVVYALVAILGATMDLGLLWSIADTFNGLMSIPNLIALLLLSGTVVQMTRTFFESEG